MASAGDSSRKRGCTGGRRREACRTPRPMDACRVRIANEERFRLRAALSAMVHSWDVGEHAGDHLYVGLGNVTHLFANLAGDGVSPARHSGRNRSGCWRTSRGPTPPLRTRGRSGRSCATVSPRNHGAVVATWPAPRACATPQRRRSVIVLDSCVVTRRRRTSQNRRPREWQWRRFRSHGQRETSGARRSAVAHSDPRWGRLAPEPERVRRSPAARDVRA